MTSGVSQSNPYLTIQNASKEIKGKKILNDLCFEIHKGEVFGVIGPDGSGKTALLKIIAGIWPLTSGSLSLEGLSFTHTPKEIRGKIGYMAFGEGLYEDLTAYENLEFTAKLYGIPSQDTSPRIRELLQKTELTKFKNLPIKYFSGGMKQKISLCAALLHRPELILLDEPSTGIDPHSRRVFWELLFNLPEEGTTILITTPYFDEIEKCERVALLSEGKIFFTGRPQDFYESSEMTALDLWPENMLEAVDYLEDHLPVETYRVRGSTLHLVYSKEKYRPEGIVESLSQGGVSLQRFVSTKVEMEDLFYLHLKRLAPPLDEKTNFRTEWIWPKEKSTCPEVVQAIQIRKSFREVEAVHETSFTIRHGEIFGLIGSNGAGKTTTLKMIGGLLKPDQGSIRVLGEDPFERREEIQSNIGYMSQNFSLYQDLTVLENIEFYAGIYSLPKVTLKKRIEWILDITGLEEQVHQTVRTLPTGWKQRLAIGCALIHDPRVIFLDEPTSGMDPVTRRYFWHWISFLAHQGRSILVTTHDMTEAEQCHRVMLMHEARVLATGSPEEICHLGNESKTLIDLECSPIKKAIFRLQRVSWVDSVNSFGNHLHLSAEKSKTDFKELKSILHHEGILLQNLSVIPYSIEDVFVERIRVQL